MAMISQVSAADDVISLDESQSEVLSVDDSQPLTASYTPKDYAELKSSIASANDGDTIELNGTYSFEGVITIDKSVNIVGVGDGAVINRDSFINFDFFKITQNASGVTLSNLKFTGGISQYGGAIYWDGDNGKIVNCEFNSAIASKGCGGSIAMYGENCTIENCIFYNNKAEQQGGALYWAGDNGIIKNCEFRDNWAEGSGIGGAIELLSVNCLVDNCTFIRNHAVNYGGAIVAYNKENRIVNSSFSENYVTGNGTEQGGGAIYSNSYGLTVDNCTFNENEARNSFGGAVYLSLYNNVKNSFFNANFAGLANDIYASESSVLMSNYVLLDYNESLSEAVFGVDASIFRNTNDVEIKKIDSVVTFIPGMAFEYGGKGTITVMVEGGEIHEENITVLNNTDAKISYKNNLLTVSGLNVGEYVLRVTTTPDDVHNSVDKDLTITVKKALAVIKVSKVTVAWKKGTLWSVKIVDSNNNRPIANMQVTLKVYTGKKYKTVNIKTNSKGIATYQTKGLSVGTHKVVLSATHSQYRFSTVKSSITVVKQTPLSFKVTSKTEKDGSILTIKVYNKATKKPINGVKVKLLVYTGKKYKTIVLKTISSGNSIGACGYSTNTLSVGTHKVVIKPVAVKYGGSATSKMIIKSSAKKYPAWTNKLSGKV